MIYDELLIAADDAGVIVKEAPLQYYDGRIDGNMIAIRRDLSTTEKGCILAEELGHYYTTSGDILDQSKWLNRKQERRARLWAYENIIGLKGIARILERGCETLYDAAEYMNVSEEFLYSAICYFKEKYGIYAKYGNRIIYFEPTLYMDIENN